jgi:hypothetical protein
MSGWPVFDAATVLQTAAFVLNWKREYEAKKAQEENAAETITRASEDINLSLRELVDKYNLTNAEAAAYNDKLAAMEEISGAKGADTGDIVKAMMSTGILDATQGDYATYLKAATDPSFAAGGALGGNYTGAGDQFASSISAAMGLEKTAADIESDAAATLLAGADEEGRLAEEMMSAKAKSVEGDTLKSAIGESAKVDKASLKEREIRAGMEAGLEKAAIDDKYKMLAPRVIGPKIPSLPGWIKSGSEKEVEVKSGTYGGTGDYRTTPKTGHDTL